MSSPEGVGAGAEAGVAGVGGENEVKVRRGQLRSPGVPARAAQRRQQPATGHRFGGRAFWVESRNISLRPVILDVAAETGAVDADELADALDGGRARRQLMDQYQIARTDAVVCSPHLFLPDGTDHPNPGVTVHYTGEYGIGFPIATADEPAIYEDLFTRAAAGNQ